MQSACLKSARNGPGDPNAPLLFTDPKLTLAMPRKSHSAVSAQDRLVRPSVRLLQTKVARQPEGRRPKRSEEHTSELQSPDHLVCRLLLEKKKIQADSQWSLVMPAVRCRCHARRC